MRYKGKEGKYHSTKMNRDLGYRSSWEKDYYEMLDNDPKVKQFFVECMKIPYFFNKKIRNYIPDILVIYEDGTKEIVEIKPVRMMNDAKNKAKFAAAEWIRKNSSYKFRIINEVDIIMIREQNSKNEQTKNDSGT